MGARFILTDKQIQSAKSAPEGSRYILWDATAPALGLRVTDKGHKSWLVQRRVNGRMVKLTLGDYPTVSLLAAREKARGALDEMVRGIDPRQSNSKPETASGLRRDSFEAAVEIYIKREVEKNRRPRTQDEIIRPLRKLLVPRWGSLPLASIGPDRIVEVLDELVDAGKPVAANRTYSVLRRFFRWCCLDRRLIPTNPASLVRKPTKEHSRTRTLSDEELREVWLATEFMEWPFGVFIRGLMLTGQRRNELAGLTWGELDLPARRWTIPAERTKNAKEHIVPLSDAMLSILTSTTRFWIPSDDADGSPSGPVFTTNGKTGVSGFSRARKRLDLLMLSMRRDAARAAGRDPVKIKAVHAWTFHDLRRSCATGMGRIGIPPYIIEAVLNHSSGFRAGVAGVYQRQPYLEERRHALNAWAEHIAALSKPKAHRDNVVEMKNRR